MERVGNVDLIVAGGPTHAFSMSRRATRADAVKHGAPLDPQAGGLRKWLRELVPANPASPLVATFDTRVEKARRLPGSAAKSAHKAFRRLGYPTAGDAKSFYVSDTLGPLIEGELARADSWADELGAHLRRNQLLA